MGFEQRIQDRRYNALLETMKAAVAVGDATGARAALDEARELRPTASELDAYELRISSIPLRPAGVSTINVGQWRAAGAVALLLAGIGFVTGIDYLQAPAVEPSQSPVESAAPSLIQTDTLVAEPVVMRPLETRPAAAAPAAEAAIAEPVLGTSGRAPVDRVEDAAPIELPSTLRPVRTERAPEPLPTGETPDDFVAPAPSLAPASRPSNMPADVLPPRSSAIVSLPPPPSAAAAAAAVARVEERRVNDVLNAYARAYDRLDASAARAVWPSVDERALARAFASLESQHLSFDTCEIELSGDLANASCRGEASYVGKVGSREPRVESRHWRFELRQDDAGWKIQRAEARRQ